MYLPVDNSLKRFKIKKSSFVVNLPKEGVK